VLGGQPTRETDRTSNQFYFRWERGGGWGGEVSVERGRFGEAGTLFKKKRGVNRGGVREGDLGSWWERVPREMWTFTLIHNTSDRLGQ